MSGLPELVLLLRGDDDLSWQDDALCAQIGGDETWFPRKGGTNGPAKAMCARCDVREDCLEYAIENREEWGIWGGSSLSERKRIVRRRGEKWKHAYREDWNREETA